MNDLRSKVQLAAAIAPRWREVAIARTARTPHRCVCAQKIRKFVITTEFPARGPGGGITSSSTEAYTPEEAEQKAAARTRRHPGAAVTVASRRNPDYRPDCLVNIAPGDPYVDYVGDAAFAENGKPYCARRGPATWGSRCLPR